MERVCPQCKGMTKTDPCDRCKTISAASDCYAKLPQIQGTKPLPLNEVISVGFGSAMLLRNNQPIWMEDGDYKYNECLTVKQAETMAALYPEDDWQIHFIGPLSEAYYQRQGKKNG